MKIVKIALTGGPCSGKSEGIAYLAKKLRAKGVLVYTVPESATHISINGVGKLGLLARSDIRKFFEVQKHILRHQVDEVRRFEEIARTMGGDTAVILADRFGMDNAAYVGQEKFREILAGAGLALSEVRDSVHGVVHLVTAADGACAHYNLKNPARTETPEQAIKLDRETMHAWVGHPHLRVIDNSTDFKGKMKRLHREVLRIAGIPESLEIERKFLLRGTPDWNHEEFRYAQYAEMKQVYVHLKSGEAARIRRRDLGDSMVYYLTRKRTVSRMVREECERIISERKYRELVKFRDPGTRAVKKRRYYFLYKGQYFELDVFKNPQGLVILEIELARENDPVELPSAITHLVVREVTGVHAYSGRTLAKMR